MPSNPFIDPTRIVRLSLPGDDWVEIHEELTVGMLRDLSRAIRPAGARDADYALYPEARVLAYVMRWSFVDASGQPAPVAAGAFEFMRPATFNAIVAAIDAHETAREEKKPTTSTPATGSAPTLQSVA
jgi:hypothetical protein